MICGDSDSLSAEAKEPVFIFCSEVLRAPALRMAALSQTATLNALRSGEIVPFDMNVVMCQLRAVSVCVRDSGRCDTAWRRGLSTDGGVCRRRFAAPLRDVAVGQTRERSTTHLSTGCFSLSGTRSAVPTTRRLEQATCCPDGSAHCRRSLVR
jgi:hypothetical protein